MHGIWCVQIYTEFTSFIFEWIIYMKKRSFGN